MLFIPPVFFSALTSQMSAVKRVYSIKRHLPCKDRRTVHMHAFNVKAVFQQKTLHFIAPTQCDTKHIDNGSIPFSFSSRTLVLWGNFCLVATIGTAWTCDTHTLAHKDFFPVHRDNKRDGCTFWKNNLKNVWLIPEINLCFHSKSCISKWFNSIPVWGTDAAPLHSKYSYYLACCTLNEAQQHLSDLMVVYKKCIWHHKHSVNTTLHVSWGGEQLVLYYYAALSV